MDRENPAYVHLLRPVEVGQDRLRSKQFDTVDEEDKANES